MTTIEKHYKITNWCDYEEVSLIGNTFGMEKEPAIASYYTKAGHLCMTQTWFNGLGIGWEIRTFTVEGV